MTSTMGYGQTERWTNTEVDAVDFIDPALGWGIGNDSSDPYGTDFADVIFYTGHSNHKCDSTNGWYYQFAMGQQSPFCWLDTSRHLLWGNDDANVAILFSCESVHLCVWQAGGYDWMTTGAFNTLLGFHGEMLLSSTNNSRLDGYLAGTRDDGIGDDWVDEMTQIKSGANNDECGTAIVFGSSSALRDNQFYNGGFRDLKATDASRSSTFYYISGCDPVAGEAL